MIVYEYFAESRIIEALYELHNGALATPRLSNNGSRLVRWNDNIELLDNLDIRVLRVCKFNAFEGYIVYAVDNNTVSRFF
jgi:hypothetical protein